MERRGTALPFTTSLHPISQFNSRFALVPSSSVALSAPAGKPWGGGSNRVYPGVMTWRAAHLDLNALACLLLFLMMKVKSSSAACWNGPRSVLRVIQQSPSTATKRLAIKFSKLRSTLRIQGWRIYPASSGHLLWSRV